MEKCLYSAESYLHDTGRARCKYHIQNEAPNKEILIQYSRKLKGTGRPIKPLPHL
jgi:hypothetical protein